MCKFITKITVPRTLWGLKPLQGYIRELAAICGVAPERLLHVEMLVEELGVNIARYSLRNDPEGQIEITVLKELSSFILRFHYRGIPAGDGTHRGRAAAEMRLLLCGHHAVLTGWGGRHPSAMPAPAGCDYPRRRDGRKRMGTEAQRLYL